MSTFENAKIGFIGVGAMGFWMAGHLAEKLPSAHIFAFDVVDKPVQDLCAKYPGHVSRGANSKDVAQQAVWWN